MHLMHTAMRKQTPQVSEKTLWEVRGIILCLMHIKRLYVNTLIIKYNYQDNRVRAFRDGKLKINADIIFKHNKFNICVSLQ